MLKCACALLYAMEKATKLMVEQGMHGEKIGERHFEGDADQNNWH